MSSRHVPCPNIDKPSQRATSHSRQLGTIVEVVVFLPVAGLVGVDHQSTDDTVAFIAAVEVPATYTQLLPQRDS